MVPRDPCGALSAHKTKDIEQFLAEHPPVRFHFPPTDSSGPNQVELRFAKIQRKVTACGVFPSVAELGNKLRKHIRAYPQSAKPFCWTYTDPSRRIIPNKIAGTSYWRLTADPCKYLALVHHRLAVEKDRRRWQSNAPPRNGRRFPRLWARRISTKPNQRF